jgi:hypothetical protein
LEGYLSSSLRLSDFFTKFGEHIFPGYNLLLIVNLMLFRVWGGFDGWIYLLGLVFNSIIIIRACYKYFDANNSFRLLFSASASFLLLSVTKNPGAGMSLAAELGTCVFIYVLFLITDDEICATIYDKLKIFIAIAIAVVFFSAGYSFGVITALSLVVILKYMSGNCTRSDLFFFLLSLLLIALVYYAALSLSGGVLFALKSSEDIGFFVKINKIVEFFVVMLASSILGKSFYESTNALSCYYLVGMVFIFLLISIPPLVIQRTTAWQRFLFGLLFYSLSIISMVSLARYRNGVGGAMGQWYNHHTHFILVSLFGLYLSLHKRSLSIRKDFVFRLVFLFLFLGAIAAYVVDWKKNYYVRDWKLSFYNQVPELLAFPENIKDKGNVMNTLLWNFDDVRNGLLLLYRNNLWIFKNREPNTYGMTSDGWLTPAASYYAICPIGANKMMLRISRPVTFPSVDISIKTTSDELVAKIGERLVEIDFNGGLPAVFIDTHSPDIAYSMPGSPDQRELIVHIDALSCSYPRGD